MPLACASFTVSMGIAISDGEETDFANVDSALHQARAEGRNRISVFDPPNQAEREPARLAKTTT